VYIFGFNGFSEGLDSRLRGNDDPPVSSFYQPHPLEWLPVSKLLALLVLPVPGFVE
jgi:hypothetical protein